MVGFSASASANIVVNGGFEADQLANGTPWAQVSSITGWTSTQSFEIQKGSNTGGLSNFNTSYEGNQYLELNSNTLSQISQTLGTTAGQAYNLSFAYSGRSDTPGGLASAMEVFWNGVLLTPTVTASANSGWSLVTFSDLIATGNNTVLSFDSIAPVAASSYGSYLDAVNVSAVPEPATYAMMLLGLCAMGLMLRRRGQGSKF